MEVHERYASFDKTMYIVDLDTARCRRQLKVALPLPGHAKSVDRDGRVLLGFRLHRARIQNAAAVPTPLPPLSHNIQ
jgi:hypothetical protein